MSLMDEYINKGLGGQELEAELRRLILEYNKRRGTYLFIYAAAIGKPIQRVQLEHDDYYVIRDLLNGKQKENLDIYLETPGGSGETAEEIVKYLHDKFNSVSFVISGEAKSAGTMMALSGDEIFMTETGSLGPIDAQMKIGRAIESAYDYMEWVDQKRKEADEKKLLNPFDATMIAQITPGELGSVFHSLEYAKDLVKDWLVKYKFKNWDITEDRKIPVTPEMKAKRADEIAFDLTDRSKWRTHGRSIKINDLKGIGLKVKSVDENKDLSEIVYRIQTICRLFFETTTIFKIFATQDNRIFRHAVQSAQPVKIPQAQKLSVVEVGQGCPKCGKAHKLYAKFERDPNIDKDFKAKGCIPFPKNSKLVCECGFEINLTGIKNEIETKLKRKMIL